MSLYGEHNVKLDALKEWAKELDLNMALMPAISLVSDYAIRVGNYYECLVAYADVATPKKLVKGFHYKNIGEINIYDEAGNAIGQVGMKSNLI
ncbi:MAG: hypothetical protein ACI4B3_10420 [Prevotella sp.]